MLMRHWNMLLKHSDTDKDMLMRHHDMLMRHWNMLLRHLDTDKDDIENNVHTD